ncbi:MULTISPECIES: Holliday junction resolvase RecU [Pontibacillus]|uniref:Holliday junction resolvase RecU n=1 Tax=Pontibacillus chungwhensis TaxID=265426 RepID=A0ABY8USP9_9BACI|nr:MULTISPECIES: Holliday junction resolvase RecU [Pontibacillus]MCD5322955.1 Holliday junction resolvase RecU [Pontibacillus sp. HN14]WIF96350.1 Holliday junction resolvase RecU [Pontibacillus chungwhensis]
MNYPNGKKGDVSSSNRKRPSSKPDFSNRGMTLEEDINQTNKAYLTLNRAVIHKKPTPVQIVNVDFPKRSAAVIKEAYFKQASTTDYNGIYKGRYIDFEAKETKNKTSFPLANIHKHQIDHMKQVCEHNGICFLIIRFTTLEETYLLPAEKLFPYWERQKDGGRKSIPYQEIVTHGYIIPLKFKIRVDYLQVLDDLYF